jgi:type IV pilus assembly protein PilZ
LVENRRHKRTSVDISVEFWARGSADKRPGRATDLSQGGVFVETDRPFGFSAEILVSIPVGTRGARAELAGVVRWMRNGGMGVQFGLLGARETNAIAELMKAPP